MVEKTSGSGKINRRNEILQAAEKLMRSRGLSGVTTRQIARAVGCSDAALYVHFKGRLELLLAMLEERLPEMLGPLKALQQSVGQGSPAENLETAMRGILRFHQRAIPLVAGLFAEPPLHSAYQASLKHQDEGPHLSLKVLEEYLEAEQKLGRISKDVDPKLAACVLMSSSFFRAFTEEFFGRPMQPTWRVFVKKLIATITPPGKPNS